MTGKDRSKKIATLGSLCGITSLYWDNFGRGHRTSQATYRDLLSAMRVPWQDPEALDHEIARRRLGSWGAVLEPVQLIAPAPAESRAMVRVWSPTPEPPDAVDISGEIVNEPGERRQWETRLKPSGRLMGHAVPGGFRVAFPLSLPSNLEMGYYDLTLRVKSGGREETGRCRLIAAPPRVYAPAWLDQGRRAWGLNLPLYAVKSSNNWGMGDFADLMAVIRWAGPLGAAFVGINPLHAPGGRAHADLSPYSPTSRVFLNVLYLSLEMAPEMPACREARDLMASPEFQAAKARLRQAPLVAYREVRRLKRQVLELLYQTFWAAHGSPEDARTDRGREFARFVAAGGESLARFGQFSALADHFKKDDWRRWPQPYRDPRSPAVDRFTRENLRQVQFFQYGQWLAAAQLGQVCQEARGQGLPFTLYEDLALGASPGGFDAWAHQELFAPGPRHRRPPRRLQSPGAELGVAAPDPGTPPGLGLPVVHRHPPGQHPPRRDAPDGPRHGAVPAVVDSPGGRGPTGRLCQLPGPGAPGHPGPGERAPPHPDHRGGPGHRPPPYSPGPEKSRGFLLPGLLF
jgi:4-alpha-glucanotransferase